MKNREIILWTVNIALIGAIILLLILNKNSNSITKISQPITPVSTITTPINNTTPSYILSEVSKHNNQTSCWTVIDGKIYDITSYIFSHPAGVNKIMKGCGIDATNMYGRVGAHDVSRLSNAFVGNLK